MSVRTIVLVDWLGRGGIAHCSEAWVEVLRGEGADVLLATRPGRELATSVPPAISAGVGISGALGAHLTLIARITREVVRVRPDVVILQNFVVPHVEVALVVAAQRAGVEVVLVAHEPAPSRAAPGGARALRHLFRRVDRLVVHSAFVGDLVGGASGRSDIACIPLPLPVGLLALRGVDVSVLPVRDGLLALHVGNLHRSYKGTGMLVDVVGAPLPPWSFGLVGRGAPPTAGATSVDRFLTPAELVATVESSHAVLLPYRSASQSGVVVLAQALGAVVLATRVGGLAEQVEDGVDGLLLGIDAPASAWREQLSALADAGYRAQLAGSALRRVTEDHVRFATEVRHLALGKPSASSSGQATGPFAP